MAQAIEKRKFIEVQPINTEQAQEAERLAENILQECKTVVINSNEQKAYAADLLQEIKGRAKKLDEVRRSITKPLDDVKKAIMDLFRNPKECYNEAEKMLKQSIITYDTEQERIRQEKEEKLRREAEAERKRKEEQARAWEEKERKKREEAERLAAEGKEEEARKAEAEAEKAAEKVEERQEEADSIVAPILAPQTQKTKGLHYIEKWSAVVTDQDKVPREYMIPNYEALNKIVQVTKGQISIPGVTIKNERILASRSK